jgi:hypothetical protein
MSYYEDTHHIRNLVFFVVKQIKKMDKDELLTLITQNAGAKKVGTKEQLPSGQAELSRRTNIPQSTM